MNFKLLKKKSTLYIIPSLVIFFNIIILLYPVQIISSAKDGLMLWFNNVIPSLLPFIIGSNILSLTGFITFLSKITAPIMKKAFNISGYGSFAIITGFISGYPIGAKTVSELYENKYININEAQKLIMFTNNSGPLFILGTVAVSMLELPQIGIIIITAHYLSALTIGILLRNYNTVTSANKTNKNLDCKTASSPQPLGTILSKSIKNSVESILSIGGFVILFSVISKILEITKFSEITTKIFTPLFELLKIDTTVIYPIVTGIIEITNGCKNMSYFSQNITTIAIITGIISWGGFSIHAQAIGFLKNLKLRLNLYFLAKATQSILSAIYVFILNIFIKIDFSKTSVATFNQKDVFFENNFISLSSSIIIPFLIVVIFSLLLYKIKIFVYTNKK